MDTNADCNCAKGHGNHDGAGDDAAEHDHLYDADAAARNAIHTAHAVGAHGSDAPEQVQGLQSTVPRGGTHELAAALRNNSTSDPVITSIIRYIVTSASEFGSPSWKREPLPRRRICT